MAITMADIARHCGVSRPAVSLILAGKANHLRAETRQRVLEAAKQFGYRPNSAARAIAKGRFGCVTMLLSTDFRRSTYSPAMLDAVSDRLADDDTHLMIARLPDEQLTSEGFVPRVLREWSCDGLLINYTDHIPERMIELIEKHRLPSIWINNRRQADCVHPDDLAAGRQATEHVLSLGHRDVAYVDFTWGFVDMHEGHYSIRDRQSGYEAAMRAAGLQPRVIRNHYKVANAERTGEMIAALHAANRPTAIVCYGTRCESIRAMERAGLRIPQDLSVMTFDDGRETSISQMVLAQSRIGTLAAEMLIRKLQNPEEALPPTAVPFELLEGETCRKL